ncbi:MAG TPA: hypothetical protein VMV69_26685, partial [Pirellulales bacterium]|nr:hypothetical protein [Pirellulales bacterium]
RDPKERGVRRRVARQLDAAFAARSDVMGYSEVVFFRFAAVLFFCTFVAAQRACFFRENDPYRFVGRSADPVSLRRGFVWEP